MGEARMAQQMGAQEKSGGPVVIKAGSGIVPYAGESETFSVTLTPFKDHGRAAYIASTIRSRAALVEVASGLSDRESQRLSQALERTMETLLDTGTISGMAVLSSQVSGKPDVYVISVGDPYCDSCLRLYCHSGEYDRSPILYQDGRATKKTAGQVERELGKAGYRPPRDYDRKKNFGKRH